MSAQWTTAREYTDIKYETTDNGSIAKITINRPHVRNAFRPLTVHEMLNALNAAHEDPRVGVVILTGEGPDAFCSGGDQKVRGNAGYIGEDGVPRLNILDVQRTIRTMPKPVVAMVAGYAIGGGHVLHVVCDLTIAADNAKFGQTGPKVGSLTEASAPPTWRASWARKSAGNLVPVQAVRCPAGAGHGPGQHRGSPGGPGGGNALLVPPDAPPQPSGPALPEGIPERRLRRADGPAGPGRQRHPALLYERGSEGRQKRLR